ncbi:hypothetical protein IE53DRAFT_22987 [Violaceomyces palustris]|uniref:Uncharacterized protein n=1 Tax=Violaceomyces palustris TaxID=1673888 RepID=A0ACD0NLG8_9BASI|nr:hypothetical protein IE53DRAFT_22987 [Violaceomyces palustris]
MNTRRSLCLTIDRGRLLPRKSNPPSASSSPLAREKRDRRIESTIMDPCADLDLWNLGACISLSLPYCPSLVALFHLCSPNLERGRKRGGVPFPPPTRRVRWNDGLVRRIWILSRSPMVGIRSGGGGLGGSQSQSPSQARRRTVVPLSLLLHS